MADFIGTIGSDDQDGTSGDDNFDYAQGGNDTLNGLEGNDTFLMGAALTAADAIDGGDGEDTVVLDGDYSLTLGANTMVNVETLQLTAGHSYAMTTNDATVAAGQILTIDASTLGSGDVLNFRGYLESDGGFHVFGGAADDFIVGGLGDDIFDGGGGSDSLWASAGQDTLYGGGRSDTLYGEAGDDRAYGGFGKDKINGGDGNDMLRGGNSDDVLFDDKGNNILYGGAGNDKINCHPGDVAVGGEGNDTITVAPSAFDVDTTYVFVDSGDGDDDVLIFTGTLIALDGGNGTDQLKIQDVTLAMDYFSAVSSGFEILLPNSFASGTTAANAFDFSGFSGASINIKGDKGDDVLTGTASGDILSGQNGNDILTGGMGSDSIRGGSGNDTLVFHAVAESTGLGRDTLEDFSPSHDFIDLDAAVTGIDSEVTVGDLSNDANFDSHLMATIDAAHLAAGHAVLYTPNSGGLAHNTFLIVDANGMDGYQAGGDFVFELIVTGIHDLSIDNFI